MIIKNGIYSNVLNPATILGPMSTSYWTLVGAARPDTIIVPTGPIYLVYYPDVDNPIAYGANPTIQIGYPSDLTAWMNGNGPGLNGLTQKITTNYSGGFAGPDGDLTNYTNQPLVISFVDASATYGPIAASSLASIGSGYSPEEQYYVDVNDRSPTLTVLTVDGSGGILTYSTDNGAAIVGGPYDLIAVSSGAGTGATLNVTSITQGNGLISLEFDYQIRSIITPGSRISVFAPSANSGLFNPIYGETI